ncbi:hypothetical protein OH77DRAFT_874799 [Trametes cingulata]|nr:hypothetical protein OH77DRAFT_874799 [Trametes cingulata]
MLPRVARAGAMHPTGLTFWSRGCAHATRVCAPRCERGPTVCVCILAAPSSTRPRAPSAVRPLPPSVVLVCHVLSVAICCDAMFHPAKVIVHMSVFGLGGVELCCLDGIMDAFVQRAVRVVQSVCVRGPSETVFGSRTG